MSIIMRKLLIPTVKNQHNYVTFHTHSQLVTPHPNCIRVSCDCIHIDKHRKWTFFYNNVIVNIVYTYLGNQSVVYGVKTLPFFTLTSLDMVGQLCKEKISKHHVLFLTMNSLHNNAHHHSQKSLWMTPILLKFPWWCGKKNHKGNNLCLWHVHKNWHVSIRSWHMVKNFTFPTTSMSFVPFFRCHVSLENVQTSYRNGSKLVSKWILHINVGRS